MPTEPTISGQVTRSSFLGLEFYTESQANSFFGRDTEIDTLTHQIQLNTLTIVFGRSGTGKTSLLNAGVFPKLRKNFCLPFRIRLEFRDDSADLITQIKRILKQEIDKYGFKVESYPSTETLWEYFHKEPLWKTVTPIIVFDQFEEIFTLARSNPRWGLHELPIFWQELSNLAENNIPEELKPKFLDQKENIGYNYKKPRAKIVFAFREEYLPEFENITAKMPSLKTSRFRLMPMNGNQAYEVITKNWKENIGSSEAKHIVSYLTNETNKESFDLVTVEPSLLSQVCAFIDKERLESGGGKVSSEFLNKYSKETILRSIYEETMNAGKNALGSVEERNPLKEFVEEKLITSEGYRLKYNLSANDDILKPGINVLVGKYFLREDDDAVELTHDVLAPIIKSDRERRRKNDALVAVRKKTRRRVAAILLLGLLLAAGSYIYATWQAKKDKELAIEDTKKMREQLHTDSLHLKKLQDSINKKMDVLSRMIETSIKDTVEKKKADSLLDELTDMNDRYGKLKVEKENVERELNIRTPKHMRLPPPVLPNYDSVELIYTKRYDSLYDEFIKLNNRFDDYIRRIPDPVPIKKSIVEIDSINGLRLKLYYSSKYNNLLNPPDNLVIYLIPYTDVNARIIKGAKVYEINCDESNLRRAQNKKTAGFSNGFYYFSNVEPGKYLIKICTYYGGFYTYTKKSAGMETLNWDASPPIR